MQKDLSPTINCLSWCMNWYAWDIILSSLRIRTHSLCVRTAIKILQLYVAATVRMDSNTAFSSSGASRMKTFKKINARLQIVILCHQLSFGYGSWIHVNQLLHRNGEEQYRPRTWGALSQLVDRGLTTIVTATTTNKNQPSVSTRFYLINSNRGHTVCM